MKRPPPSTDCESSVGSKRRRLVSTSEDDDCSRGKSSSKSFGDSPPLHKIYNSSCRKEKPDELFRKDLISAMKLPDNEQLDESVFWDVSDSWKQEWERGVQVPVNSKNVPNPQIRTLREKSKAVLFKLPKKLMRTSEDKFFSSEHHVLTEFAAKAEKVCKYDMDDLDSRWLTLFNEYREDTGQVSIQEETMERVLEDFELQCSNGFQDALKTEKGLGIEYDENVVCDVCRARENEDGNEMVFCDMCNICVHQACYGIMAIPEGSWVCKPCAANIKPPCVLCPNTGGAMKATGSGEKWAHVSCALWIPEVSIGCPEKMEPILKISQIPTSRWALICTLCRERVGACIQCSVKQCKVAYHVTCAIEHGLEMEIKITPLDSSDEGVKLQSYCHKHGKKEPNTPEKSPPNKSPLKKRKKRKDSLQEKQPENEVDEHNARLQKIRSLEAEFFNYVTIKETVGVTKVEYDVVSFLYYYWLLKRRAKFNKPLLITKCDEANLLIKQHENLLYSRLKMFVHLRQDLERVRNLCYMISRREKIFRSYLRTRNEVFEKQLEVVNEESESLTPKDIKDIVRSRLGDNLYDKFYCFPLQEEEEEKDPAPKLPNPYSKIYPNNVHTRSRRNTATHSCPDNSDDSRDMPVLIKCRSEESVNGTEVTSRKQPVLTQLPIVVKIEPSVENNIDESNQRNLENPVIHMLSLEKTVEPVSNEFLLKSKPSDHDILNGGYDITGLKSKKLLSDIGESAIDKNSSSLSDKENINGQKPMKIKKTRSQSELKHSISDIGNSELYIDENAQSEMSITENKRNSRFEIRSSRYPRRTRFHSNDIVQDIETVKVNSNNSIDICTTSPVTKQCIPSPCNSVEDIHFIAQIPETPRRRRGRPRKIPQLIVPDDDTPSVIPSEGLLAVIKTEPCDNLDDKTNSCNSSPDLSDTNQNGFRMSLRNARDHPVTPRTRGRRAKKRRTVLIKLEPPDLEEINQIAVSETVTLDSEGMNSPDWNSEDTRPPRLTTIESPASTRIVIRLRKDPNRESWKNDSSSSSDVPAAFHIVRNNLDNNSDSFVSEFPSKINGGDSPDSEVYSIINETENRHRYSMRNRTAALRNIKCTFRRS